MKVVVAIDSFKGSLSSNEAGNIIKKGINQVFNDAEVIVKPLADGGEGTVESLVIGMQGNMVSVNVTGPLGKKVLCKYGIIKNKTAIIEMSAAAGLPLVPPKLRNPLITTTYGVGEVIIDAISRGCKDFIIGIGGSATNDGGIGMLQALGFEFLDELGNKVGGTGKDLIKIKKINTSNAFPQLKECNFKIACDVNNPLFGTNGAAYIYGPQKGATPEIVMSLDEGLINYSETVKKELGIDIATYPGTGAAGGLGYAFMAFLNGKLEPGINIIINEIKLEDDIKDSDFVITGEGRLDQQTMMGKAPSGVANLAKKYGKKVIAFAGSTTDDAKECNKQGIDAYFAILQRPVTIAEAIKKDVAEKNLLTTVIQVFNLIKILQ